MLNPDRNIFSIKTNIYFFFILQRFGPSPSPNFKSDIAIFVQYSKGCLDDISKFYNKKILNDLAN